ncbi:hypothetical protein [Methanolapillus millepedarum]|uniref:Uncharacterized protein n=1 Tax=Methanolapillus millepedarum TaxID=3028296 RepID=A0AA96V3R4_9EURY|nr:hypothetical protein MsAc7_16210 [Methanosarcinaceae archaeon Ac7]
MNPKSKMVLFLCFIIVIVAGIAIVPFVLNKTEDIRKPNDLNLTHTEMQEIYDQEPPINPSFFEKNIHEDSTLYHAGFVPELNRQEAYEWRVQIHTVASNAREDPFLKEYLDINGGPITFFSDTASGYMNITISSSQKSKLMEKDFKKIKQIIEKYALKEGIKNIPIIIHEEQPDKNEALFRYIHNEVVFLSLNEVKIYEKWKENPIDFKNKCIDENVLYVSKDFNSKTGDELYEWWKNSSYHSVGDLFNNELKEYSRQNSGPITGYSLSSFGFIIIYVDLEKSNELSSRDFKIITDHVEKTIIENGLEPLAIIFYSEKYEPRDIFDNLVGYYIITDDGHFVDDSVIHKYKN